MSLCDTCTNPGHCCKSFVLWTNELEATEGWAPKPMTEIEVRRKMVSNPDKWPFVLASVDPDGVARWSCPKLDSRGRCSIYEQRPQLCRDFEPGSDPEMCVMSK